jgi:hypothetical protein
MSWAPILLLTKVGPASDIKDLPSHTSAKAATDGKEQLATVTHPAAHVEDMRDQGHSGPPFEQVPDLSDEGTAGALQFY